MPSSRPNTIPIVISLLRQINPRSILDVGIGFGKWGHLFREYTDINEAEQDPARYRKENWKIRIDGIEGHAAYLTEMHRYLYDAIHVGDAREILPGLGRYDLVFLGDIIEHFTKEEGFALLGQARAKAGKAVLVSTPKFETSQTDLCANELERHRSLWSARDFRRFEGARIKTVDRDTLLALLPNPSLPEVRFIRPRAPDPVFLGQLEALERLLRDRIPLSTPFVLIDDEQLRPRLPHEHSLPFLEKDGHYWGPPADDETAWRELDRLRRQGARFLAVAAPSFWWLDHYRVFFRRVSEHFPCRAEDSCWRLYELRPGPD